MMRVFGERGGGWLLRRDEYAALTSDRVEGGGEWRGQRAEWIIQAGQDNHPKQRRDAGWKRAVGG